MADDDLTATLAEVRMQADDHHLVPAGMVYPLLGAVEAVLKLPEDWQRETARLDHLASTSDDPQTRVAVSMRAQAFEECARSLRGAIARELTKGEGSTDG